MTDEQINRACAELDGYTVEDRSYHYDGATFHYKVALRNNGAECHSLKSYTTSYDNAIPLIQKQPDQLMGKFEVIYAKLFGFDVWHLTPRQLCEALLRAAGKWEESK